MYIYPGGGGYFRVKRSSSEYREYPPGTFTKSLLRNHQDMVSVNSCQTWYMKIIFAFVSDFATAVKPAKKLGEEKTNSSIEAVEGLAVSISWLEETRNPVQN